jgi:hypothetical protein
VTVAAGPLVVEVPAEIARHGVWLDGNALDLSTVGGGDLIVAVDMARQTGYHDLTSRDSRWLFATDDAKLRIDGIRQILEFLATAGLGWSGVMFFTGETRALRDLRLDKAWMDQHGPDIVRCLRTITTSPEFARASHFVRSASGVPNVPRTMRLLHQYPTVAEPMEGGPIGIPDSAGRTLTFGPVQAIVRRSRSTLDTPANERATALAMAVRKLISQIVRAAPQKSDVRQIDELGRELDDLQRRPPFVELRRLHRPLRLGGPPSAVEVHNQAYRRCRQLSEWLRQERHWEPSSLVLPERAYVGHSDAIWQQFCAHVIARARGLQACEVGRADILRFESAEWTLYSNSRPPRHIIQDWRSRSERPADLRPDLVIVRKADSKVAVLDAKYRVMAGRATASALMEIQFYMQCYGLASIGVLYPADASLADLRIHRVEDSADPASNSIREIPLRPEPSVLEYVRYIVWPEIETLLR